MDRFIEYITLTNVMGIVGILLVFYFLYSNTRNSKETKIYIGCFVLFILSILLMLSPYVQTHFGWQSPSWKTIYKTGDDSTLELTGNDFDITTNNEIGINSDKLKVNTPIVIKAINGKHTETRTANITEINGHVTPDSKLVKIEYDKEKSTIRITVAKTDSNRFKSIFDD